MLVAYLTMLGQTVSHYSAFWFRSLESRTLAESKKAGNPASKRNPRLPMGRLARGGQAKERDKILEKGGMGVVYKVPRLPKKLGFGGQAKLPTSEFQRVAGVLIPLCGTTLFVGTQRSLS